MSRVGDCDYLKFSMHQFGTFCINCHDPFKRAHQRKSEKHSQGPTFQCILSERVVTIQILCLLVSYFSSFSDLCLEMYRVMKKKKFLKKVLRKNLPKIKFSSKLSSNSGKVREILEKINSHGQTQGIFIK